MNSDHKKFIRLLITICLIIIVFESLTMAALHWLPVSLDPVTEIFADAVFLAVLSTPLIYALSIRPYINKTDSIISTNDELKTRVQERTGDLHKAVSELSQMDHLLGMVLENVPGAIVVTDEDLQIVLCSPQFSEIYQAPPEYLALGSYYQDFIRYLAENGYYGDRDVDELVAERIESVKNPGGERFEDHSPDGKTFSVTRSKMDDGWTITTATDITDLKQIEQNLRDSEQRLFAINDTVQAGIVMANVSDGEIFFANAEAGKILGTNVRKLFVMGWEDIFYDPNEWEEFLVRFSYEGHVKHQEIQIKRPDGHLAWIFASLTNVSGEDKDTLLMSFIDITERKKTEEHLRQAQKMDALGSLAGGIAHDLNNMLLPILTLTGMTAKELPEGSSGRERLEKVVLAAEKAGDLINRILVFSRQDLDNQKKEVDLYTTVTDAMYLLHATLPASISIKESLNADVGSVLADPAQIQTIFLNLASNSIDAIEGGIGEIDVVLKQTVISHSTPIMSGELAPATWAELSVRDTGCGMDEQTMNRIFDPFFTTKEVGEGTGVGLSMVHGIITSHDGAWDVISSPGEGTTFHIFLPLIVQTHKFEDTIKNIGNHNSEETNNRIG